MANFGNRGGNKRFGGGGRPSFGGGNRSFKPSFNKKSWGGDRSEDRGSSPHLHKATCSVCGKTCEVPFRPIAGKPVYCKECFGNLKGNGERGEDRGERRETKFPKKEFNTQTYRSEPKVAPSNEAVTQELQSVNAKLERLIQAVESLAKNALSYTDVSEDEEVIEEIPTPKKKKKASKK